LTYSPKPARPMAHYRKVGCHGETGDGKSRLGAGFPGPRVWLDPTHGCDYFLQPGDFIENSLNMDTVIEAADYYFAEAHAGRVKSIIFDDVSMYQYQLTGTMAEDPAKVTMDEWGPIKGLIIRMMLKACAAPCHILVTSRASLVGVESDSAGHITSVHKAARPKAWPEWIHPVDFQFYLYTKGSELAPDKIRYFAQIQKSRAEHIASLREGRIIENPSFDTLFKDLLIAEAGAEPPVYDDPDAAIAAARTARGKLNTVALEQLFLDTMNSIKISDTMDTLAGAWTRATNLIQDGKFNEAQQKELLLAKNAAKARVQANAQAKS
jgi:hypothetical protein